VKKLIVAEKFYSQKIQSQITQESIPVEDAKVRQSWQT